MDIEIKTEYIKLNQLLKLAGIISAGSDTKYFISEKMVKLNNVVVTELRKKIYPNDILEITGFGKINIYTT